MLSIDDIVNINSSAINSSSGTRQFGLCLLLSANTVITTTARAVLYTSTADMIAAGFTQSSPEVTAAALYFGQTPRPTQILVGVKGTSETFLQALTACRQANTDWYIACLIGAADTDITACAQYIETASPVCTQFYTTTDSDVINGVTGNLCSTLQSANYSRTLGQYSSAPNAVASIAGYACAEGLENAAILEFQTEPGVTPEPLTQQQSATLKSLNCNFLATRGDYTFFQYGTMANGSWFDDILGMDILKYDIQSAILNVLTSTTKVPQTDAGVELITQAIATACQKAVDREYIAAGTWTGGSVGSLNNGDTLPNGYSIQVGKIADQPATDKANRVAPPIYVCIIRAGAIQSVVITVNTNI